MHVLITGSVQVGKSTLVKQIVKRLGRPVCGFETRKEEGLKLADGGVPIYIYPAGGPYRQTEENRIGISRNGRLEIFTEAFDCFLEKGYWQPPQGDAVIVMDEIGHMETGSDLFCDQILRMLDGEYLVIAAVKDKKKPFLEQVRNHPNSRCFVVSEDNRNALLEEIWEFIQTQETYRKGNKRQEEQ